MKFLELLYKLRIVVFLRQRVRDSSENTFLAQAVLLKFKKNQKIAAWVKRWKCIARNHAIKKKSPDKNPGYKSKYESIN